MKKSQDNRHGKHKPDKVLLGGYVTPEFKALAQLVASMKMCSVHELLQEGVYTMATSIGVMKNGVIVPAYRPTVDAMAEIIRTKRDEKRA
mgnify:CR=1 FL=1